MLAGGANASVVCWIAGESILFFLHQPDDIPDFCGDLGIVFPAMWQQALGAIFDPVIVVLKITAAGITEGV